MKTLKTLFTVALITALTACGADTSDNISDAVAQPGAEKVTTTLYSVQPASSKLMWKGSMLNVKAHEGTLNFSKGEFTTDGEKLVGGVFMVDMMSMSPTDDMYDEEKTREGLVGHLQTADFFDVANYPTARLEVKEGKAFLTVRGETNEVELDKLTMAEKDGVMTASAEMRFDRQKFGVAFSTGAADFVISDEIVIKVDISAKKS